MIRNYYIPSVLDDWLMSVYVENLFIILMMSIFKYSKYYAKQVVLGLYTVVQ